MSMKETSDRTASENRSPMNEAAEGLVGPHFASQPPQVLARMPNLESAESELAEHKSAGRRDGRLLSSRLSVKILAVGGALVLVAALVLPLLFNNSEPSDAASDEDFTAWQVEGPAPSAPAAPAWEGNSPEGSNWQAGAGVYGFSQPETPAVPAYSQDSQPADWGVASPPQAWNDSAPNARSEPADVPTWNGQPATQPWAAQPDPLANGSQPEWQGPDQASNVPTWGGQPSMTQEADLAGQTGWNEQPNWAPAAREDPTASWNSQSQTPSWQSGTYPLAGQPQSQWEYPAPPVQSPAPIDPSQQLSAGYGSYQPRADTNRPMAIYDDLPSGTADYRANDQSQPQPEYHTADARAAAAVENTIDPGSGYQTAVPAAAYPPAGYPPSSLPSADYRSTGDPLAGSRAATGLLRNDGYPGSYDPARIAPATDYPSGNYSANNYAESTYPTGNYPTGNYPSGNYPSGNYPSGNYPSRNYPTSAPSAAASPASEYRAGAYPRYSEPPVARFRGGIERATGSSLYDSDRPSVH